MLDFSWTPELEFRAILGLNDVSGFPFLVLASEVSFATDICLGEAIYRIEKLTLFPLKETPPHVMTLSEELARYLNRNLFYSKDVNLTRLYYSQEEKHQSDKFWWNKHFYSWDETSALRQKPFITYVIHGFVSKIFGSVDRAKIDLLLISKRSLGKSIETERFLVLWEPELQVDLKDLGATRKRANTKIFPIQLFKKKPSKPERARSYSEDNPDFSLD